MLCLLEVSHGAIADKKATTVSMDNVPFTGSRTHTSLLMPDFLIGGARADD